MVFELEGAIVMFCKVMSENAWKFRENEVADRLTFASAMKVLTSISMALVDGTVVVEVDGEAQVRGIADGATKFLLFVTDIDFTPMLPGTYTKLPDGLLVESSVRVAGMNAPPPPLSVGVTRTLPV